MKKILSLILILSLICTLGLTPVKAAGTFSIAYTLPSRLNTSYGKNIPVNIGEVKVVFTEAVDPDTLSGITFEDSNGDAPKGGIFVSLDDTKKIVTVKFGELNPKATNVFDGVYNLTIPATVKSESGENFEGKTIDFVTCGQKTFVDHDFSDTTKWTAGSSYTVPTTEAYFQGGSTYSSDYGYFRLYAGSSAASTKATLKITDNGTLNLINGSSTADLFMATNFTATFNAKFVAKWKFKVNSGYTQSGDFFAGLYSGLKIPLTNHGLSLDNLAGDFSKDDDGFYDVTVYASRLETAVDGQNVTFENSIDAKDNISGNTAKTPHSSTATGNAVTNKDASNKAIVLSRFNIVKSYRANNDIEFASIKQGFYTIPEPLSEIDLNNEEKTISFIANTDIDASNSTATVDGQSATVEVDSATRKITVTYSEALVENRKQNIVINLVSLDGFDGKIETSYGEDPAIASKTGDYTVDHENFEITGVAPGTTKAGLLNNLNIIVGYEIKDSTGTTITEDTTVLKDNTKIALENGTEYTVKLDFENNPDLITEKKYEFITDGNASDDADNVYDEVQSIKVSFNVAEFTTIDSSNFNVSIYETANTGNIVSVANPSFADNAYTFDVTGTLEEGKNYTLKLQGVKDTVFEQEYTFTKAFTVVATPEPTYSVESGVYTVDNEALKITGVEPGTTREGLLDKLTISGGYQVKDANGNEISEDTTMLKDNTKIVLGNGVEYTVKLDLEDASFISATKYEFIIDGNASEDATNVYDSVSGIKVSFNVEAFTAIDSTSFNVSIYETANPENTVAVSNGSFNENVYSFNITGNPEVGKNYTLKLQGVKDTIFEKEHTFTKEFTVVETPKIPFNALYTIPNILPTVSNKIGVNQEEIKVYFEEALASGIENITFTDSLGNAPIGGITVSANGKVATIKFGELKEEETYTLSIPTTLVSTEGGNAVAKDFEFVTLKKTFADADFSDSLTWADGTYTAAQINEKGKVTAYFKTASKTNATIEDSLLKVALSGSADTYLGVNAGYMTTAKLVSFVKYKVDFKNENTSGFTLGGMWSGQFNTNVPKTGSNGNFAVAGNGVPYSTVDSNGFVKEEGTDLYDITVTSTYKEKEVSADMTKKTMDASVVVRDNNSDKVINQADTNTMTYNFDETIAKVSHFSVLKTYFRNDVSFAKIKQGFYTVPAPLGLPEWNKEAKTITYVMNTDIDVAKSSVTVGELPATLAFDSSTRKLTVTYTGDIVEGEDYKVSFGNVISLDGLRGEGEATFNTVLLSVVSANPMNGSKIKAQAGTMTFVFSQNVTKEALEANATFMRKETEETVPVTFTVADDNRTATMAYPALLNSAEYVLKMPKTFIFGGLEYSYMTTGSNTIKSLTPSFNLADSNEINPYLGLIKVEFNDPVTLDMAKQYITLKQGTTVDSINITEDNGVFSIWLPVLEAQKTYTFTISDILLEEKCEITLDVQTPTQVITTTPASGKTIDVNEREITITFQNEYTLSQLENAISFVDDNGNGPKGGVYIRKDETDPKKVILRFGRLEEKTFYHIVINSLPNADNIMFNYTTGGTYALEVTFDDWETGKIETPATGATYAKNGIILGHASGKLAESEFEIKENSDGTKYLQVKATKKSKNIAVGYKFPTPMESGKFIAEMGVRSGSTSAEGFKSSANSILTHATSGSPGGGTALDANAISTFSAFTTNANGFYELTAELTKTTTETSITYTGKNDASVSWGPKSFVSAINSVAFLKMYSNQSADDTLSLDYVKAYFVKDLDVVNLLNGFDPINKQIEIVFSEDVDAESLKALKLTSASHNVDLEFVSYNERKAIFNLSEHLNYGTDYEISFKDVKGTSGFVMMTETPIKFKTMEYAIKGSDEAVTSGELTLILKNSLNENRNYKVSIVLYDSSDRVIKAKTVEGTAFTGDTPVTVTTGVSGYADYKIFIWDITNGYYVPVK